MSKRLRLLGCDWWAAACHYNIVVNWFASTICFFQNLDVEFSFLIEGRSVWNLIVTGVRKCLPVRRSGFGFLDGRFSNGCFGSVPVVPSSKLLALPDTHVCQRGIRQSEGDVTYVWTSWCQPGDVDNETCPQQPRQRL